ncbi:nodulation efficiency protein NfeD [Bacillaceae bacterium Marseille-Q3522]|nr:nodulation efficiency protein NfeD [Bacillaceae bacterium Marseille-Q3522]
MCLKMKLRVMIKRINISFQSHQLGSNFRTSLEGRGLEMKVIRLSFIFTFLYLLLLTITPLHRIAGNEFVFATFGDLLTNPYVVPVLLTIGILGLAMELFSPGFGIPGFVGLTFLLLFFYGHLMEGVAGFESVVLFFIGLLLLILEIFLVGGIAGTLGLLAVFSSFFFATDNFVHTAVSLLIAVSISIFVSILMIKVYGKKMKFFKKLILSDSTSTEKGYVSNRTRTELVGKNGYALTALRPAGTIVINDERIDAVSEGPFILKDAQVIVVKAEGSRIVVRKTEEHKP